MKSAGHATPRLRLVVGGRAASPSQRLRPARALPTSRRSPHLRLLLKQVERSALRAAAEAIGAAIGVTDDELLIARARWFGGGTVQRFRLSAVSAVKIHPPAGVRRLHVVVAGRLCVLLFAPRADSELEAVTTLLSRPAARGRRKRAAGR